MPFGKTARIQQADRQFGKHLNQIKRVCENELSRETRCIEEVFKLEMVGSTLLTSLPWSWFSLLICYYYRHYLKLSCKRLNHFFSLHGSKPVPLFCEMKFWLRTRLVAHKKSGKYKTSQLQFFDYIAVHRTARIFFGSTW